MDDIERARDPNPSVTVLDAYVATHRERLERALRRRMRWRWLRRTDPGGLISAAHVVGRRRWDEYVKGPLSLPRWFGRIVCDQRSADYQHHKAKRRDMERDAVPPTPDGSQDFFEQQNGRESTPDARATANELLAEFKKAIGELDPLEQRIVQLRMFECLQWNDVAARLGITSEKARKRFERVLTRLVDRLDLERVWE